MHTYLPIQDAPQDGTIIIARDRLDREHHVRWLRSTREERSCWFKVSMPSGGSTEPAPDLTGWRPREGEGA